MRGLVPALLVALSVTIGACEPKPSTVEWQGHTLQEVRTLAGLPAAIQAELGVGRPGTDGVADRGRPFNVTDVTRDNLPMRRLLTAGRDGDTWLVAFERGGRAHYVEVFLFTAGEATPKQKWVISSDSKSLSGVVQQISQEER